MRWLLERDRVCESCGSTFTKKTPVGKFLSHVKYCQTKRAQKLCPDCGKPMIRHRAGHVFNDWFECTNEDCAVIEIKEGEIHRATMLKKEAEA